MSWQQAVVIGLCRLVGLALGLWIAFRWGFDFVDRCCNWWDKRRGR